MTKKQWIAIQNKQAIDSDDEHEISYGFPSLWVLMEDAFNEVNRNILGSAIKRRFSTGGKVILALDYDKVRCDSLKVP